MSFITFCFLIFIQCLYSTSILEARIEDSTGDQEDGKVRSAASASCPDGWIESLEGCFYFANTGEERKWKKKQGLFVACSHCHWPDLERGPGAV